MTRDYRLGKWRLQRLSIAILCICSFATWARTADAGTITVMQPYKLLGPGQYYPDAEKNVWRFDDENMCWAASGANLLSWTGWADYTEDYVFQLLLNEDPLDVGALQTDAWDYWLYGKKNDGHFAGSSHKGIISEANYPQGQLYRETGRNVDNIRDGVVNMVQDGYGIGGAIWGSIHHAVTIWGYDQNTTTGDLTRVYVTDSDTWALAWLLDTWPGYIPAPNSLEYLDLTKRDNLYYITGSNNIYYDIFISNNAYLLNTYGLAPYREPLVPALSTTPAHTQSLAFGHVLVGQSVALAITAENSGDPGSWLTVECPDPNDPEFKDHNKDFEIKSDQVTVEMQYSYKPTERGGDVESITITSNGGDNTIKLVGTGVAPVVSAPTSAGAGPVRIGTSGSVSVTVTNIGDGNLSGLGAISDLNGSLTDPAATGPFAPNADGTGIALGDGESNIFTFSYTPTEHAFDTDQINLVLSNGNPSGDNSPITSNIALSGTGIGPEFEALTNASGGVSLESLLGSMAFGTLTIVNDTSDPDTGNLDDLTLLDLSILGPDASFFNVTDFIPGALLSSSETINLTVSFAPISGRPYDATIRLITDQHAAFGQAGDYFDVNVTGVGVPDPASGLVFAMGTLIILLRGARTGARSGQ